MTGTAWTEPGQGATVGELADAYCFERDDWRKDATVRTLEAIGKDETRTNLALTGQPLTGEDVENIGRAK